MRRLNLVLLTGLLLAGAGNVVVYRIESRQREQLSARGQAVEELRAALRDARQHLDQTRREHQLATESGARADALAAGEDSPVRLWAMRVALLRQLLVELPAHHIPEIRLLRAVDWIDVARKAELDTADQIRESLSKLRAAARLSFGRVLQEALRRYADASGGMLPGDIYQLAGFLSSPADASLLDRYTLARTGRVGDRTELLITERPTADLILSVGLDGWKLDSGPNPLPAPGESELATMKRTMAALGAAAGMEGEAEHVAQFMSGFGQMVESIVAEVATAGGDTVGEEIATALKRFTAAHPGQKPADLAELLPHVNDVEKLMTVARPLLAHLQYAVEHDFKPPARPEDLAPYLQRNYGPEALRRFTITTDGDSLSVSFSASKVRK